MRFCCNSPSTSAMMEWRSGTKMLMYDLSLCEFARRTIGKRAPRKLPRVNSLLTRRPVRMVGVLYILFSLS